MDINGDGIYVVQEYPFYSRYNSVWYGLPVNIVEGEGNRSHGRNIISSLRRILAMGVLKLLHSNHVSQSPYVPGF